MSASTFRAEGRTAIEGKAGRRWWISPRQLCVLALAAGVFACKPPETPVVEMSKAGDQIACAPSGVGRFTNDCTVERHMEEGALVLVVRHPDGGFRRFVRVDDGSELVVADGMQSAKGRFTGQVLELAVGADRYRFPASAMNSESNI